MTYTIFTGDGCPWCDSAKAIMDMHGVPYSEININDEENLVFLRIMFDLGHTTVPQVYDKEGYHIGGYRDLEKHLEYIQEISDISYG